MRPSRENSSDRHVMFGTLMRSSSFREPTCQMRMSSKPHVANSSELPLHVESFDCFPSDSDIYDIIKHYRKISKKRSTIDDIQEFAVVAHSVRANGKQTIIKFML